MMKRIIYLLVLVVIYNVVNSQIPTNGLVAWYPFTGNAIDSSGNGHNGTVVGASLTTDRFGNANSAYHFNGINNYISTIHGNPIGSRVTTISLWLKTSSNQIMNPIAFSSGNSVIAVSLNNPCFGIGIDGGTGVVMKGSNKILDNKWHHCIMIIDSTVNATIYIDGILQTSQTCSLLNPNLSINATNCNPYVIGANESAQVRFFNGDIDDILVYKRALDSTEIKTLYNATGNTTNPNQQNGLIAWFPFTGNAIDSSGNGHNGTLKGVSLTTDRFGNQNSAYSFTGNNTISIPYDTSLNIHKNYSIALWYLTNADTYPAQDIFIKGTYDYTNNVFYLRHHASNFSTPTLRFEQTEEVPILVPGIGVETQDPSKNNWHFVVLTFTNSYCRFYVDNKLVDSLYFSLLDSNLINTQNLSIGGGYYTFSGKIDDIRIYNRPLSSTEIQTLYHAGGYLLPVSILNINAYINGNLLNVNWQTATELNTSNFIIQHSIDGNSFKSIGSVNAMGNGANSYQFTDINPVNGINYYRLQIVDKDGSTSYSKVISTEFSVSNSQLNIYPNPAKNLITIKMNHINSIEVIDNVGKMIDLLSFKDVTNPIININHLTVGVYHLSVKTIDGKTRSSVFIKE